MAFGQQFARAAALDQQKQMDRAAQEESAAPSDPSPLADMEKSPAGSSPVENTPGTGAPGSRRRTRFDGAGVLAAPSAGPGSFRGVPSASTQSHQLPSPSSRPAVRSGIGFERLERLIEVVGNFQEADAAQRQQWRKDAARDLPGTIRRLDEIHETQIKPWKKKSVESLGQAIRDNPDKVVAQFVRGQVDRVKKWSQQEAQSNGYTLLHATVVEIVSAEQTPFPPPRALLGPAPVEAEVVVADGAFAETSARPRP